MTRGTRGSAHSVSCRRHNLSAIVVACLAVSVLYLNFNPTPVGADPEALNNRIEKLTDMMSADMDFDSGSGRSHPGSADQSAGDANRVQGHRAILLQVLLLEKGLSRLTAMSDYSAVVFTQERVGGVLLDPQVMQLKMRHEPLGIYMKWLVGDKGRELLFVDGENNGDMVVKVGGIKGKLLPPMNLNPSGSIALQEARYPATQVGMLYLCNELLRNRRTDLDRGEGCQCVMLPDREFDERPCFCFRVEFDDPQFSNLYRKSIVLIDREWCVPVMVKNFTWPLEGIEIDPANLDKETLIEHYSYSDIQFDQRFADADFSRENNAYSFVR